MFVLKVNICYHDIKYLDVLFELKNSYRYTMVSTTG